MIVKIFALLTFFKIICFSDVDQDQRHQLELGKALPVTREQNKNDSILGFLMEDEMRRVDRFDENGYEDEDEDIYIMMSVCLSEKSSLLGFSWFLVGFHGF